MKLPRVKMVTTNILLNAKNLLWLNCPILSERLSVKVEVTVVSYYCAGALVAMNSFWDFDLDLLFNFQPIY